MDHTTPVALFWMNWHRRWSLFLMFSSWLIDGLSLGHVAYLSPILFSSWAPLATQSSQWRMPTRCSRISASAESQGGPSSGLPTPTPPAMPPATEARPAQLCDFGSQTVNASWMQLLNCWGWPSQKICLPDANTDQTGWWPSRCCVWPFVLAPEMSPPWGSAPRSPSLVLGDLGFHASCCQQSADFETPWGRYRARRKLSPISYRYLKDMDCSTLKEMNSCELHWAWRSCRSFIGPLHHEMCFLSVLAFILAWERLHMLVKMPRTCGNSFKCDLMLCSYCECASCTRQVWMVALLALCVLVEITHLLWKKIKSVMLFYWTDISLVVCLDDCHVV